MPEKFTDITFTILVTTIILFFVGGLVVYFLFAYQRKRFKHHQELFELKENFNKTLLESRLEIQEQTLDHIAKELHANFSNLISLININLSTLSKDKPEEWNEKVIGTKSLAKQLMSELKALTVSLNTEHNMHIGFLRGLENELRRLDKPNLFKVKFTKIGSEYQLAAEKEIILFRMCQEIINNIVQHSGASAIEVMLDYGTENFQVEIKDNGRGFSPDQAELLSQQKGSTGLRNIKSRAKLIQADLIIVTAPAKGASFQIKINH